jgi:hypothetical protein
MDLSDATKTALGILLDKEEIRWGSREVAYDQVARAIGASSSWLKKYLSPQSAVADPRLDLFDRIRVAYIKLCERIEQENRLEEARITALKDHLDETTESFMAKVAALSRRPTH